MNFLSNPHSEQRGADDARLIAQLAEDKTRVALDVPPPEFLPAYLLAQRRKQCFTLIGNAAGERDDLRKENVDHVCHARRKKTEIRLHDLVRRMIAAFFR